MEINWKENWQEKMSQNYRPMTFRAWLELVTPNTWGASILPVLLGSVLAYGLKGDFSLLRLILLLFCAVFMHCAVNALNHLFDFLKDTDNLENCLDPHDAPMVYHNLHPRTVAALAVFYLFMALALSLYLLLQVGWPLLFMGVFGAAVVVCYAGGPLPITHTPFGELAAGFTMGGVITFAAYYSMTASLDWVVLLYALPPIITIGCILLLNNVCDIEKDIEAGRRTMPILIGRKKATLLLKGGYVVAAVIIEAILIISFPKGCWVFPIVALLSLKKFKAVMTMEFRAETRMAGMKVVLPLTPLLNFGYVLSVFVASF